VEVIEESSSDEDVDLVVDLNEKKCRRGKILSVKGNCVKRMGKAGMEALALLPPGMACGAKGCKNGKICNPGSGVCVKKSGAIGKKLLEAEEEVEEIEEEIVEAVEKAAEKVQEIEIGVPSAEDSYDVKRRMDNAKRAAYVQNLSESKLKEYYKKYLPKGDYRAELARRKAVAERKPGDIRKGIKLIPVEDL
jgi:hypothetical protein